MSRRTTIKALLEAAGERPPAAEAPDATGSEPPDPAAAAARRVPAGAVRALGLSLERLQEEAAAASTLRERLAGGQAVVEVDPALVDDSFAADRLPAGEGAELQELVESIRGSGQQVPALLRPHPDAPGRFQVAYGHRRLHAVRVLGVRLRAVVRPLSDAELVIAQGQENLGRRDLTFIERALFAARLEARGFDRATLNAALSVHSAEMTRFLAVTRAVPEDLVRAIGPAPRAGRTRWMELARLLGRGRALSAARACVAEGSVAALGSDARFAAVLQAARGGGAGRTGVEVFRAAGGIPIARVEHATTTVRVTVDERMAPGFGRFLADRLASLHRAFLDEAPED